MTCASDFLSRVGEFGSRGLMSCGTGTGPVQSQAQQNSLESAVAAMAPANYSESDIEQLVQTITDQIMAAAG
jgi:hypothetical protein